MGEDAVLGIISPNGENRGGDDFCIGAQGKVAGGGSVVGKGKGVSNGETVDVANTTPPRVDDAIGGVDGKGSDG